MSDTKVFRRERKFSNSSSISSASSYSTPAPVRPKRRPPPKTPKRASSAPLIDVAAPPTELSQQHGTPQVAASSSSSPLHSQCHAPLQIFPLMSLLPFVAPPTPHPHYVYGPVPQVPPTVQTGHDHSDPQPHPLSGQLSVQPHPLSAQPHPFAYNVLWNGMVTDASSQSALQAAWGPAQGHVATVSDHVTKSPSHVTNLAPLEKNRSGTQATVNGNGPLYTGSPLATPPGIGGCGPPLATPPGIGGYGPALGFYSILNNKELTPAPSSNIWTPTPPSGSQSQQEEEGEWPDWPNASTQ